MTSVGKGSRIVETIRRAASGIIAGMEDMWLGCDKVSL